MIYRRIRVGSGLLCRQRQSKGPEKPLRQDPVSLIGIDQVIRSFSGSPWRQLLPRGDMPLREGTIRGSTRLKRSTFPLRLRRQHQDQDQGRNHTHHTTTTIRTKTGDTSVTTTSTAAEAVNIPLKHHFRKAGTKHRQHRHIAVRPRSTVRIRGTAAPSLIRAYHRNWPDSLRSGLAIPLAGLRRCLSLYLALYLGQVSAQDRINTLSLNTLIEYRHSPPPHLLALYRDNPTQGRKQLLPFTMTPEQARVALAIRVNHEIEDVQLVRIGVLLSAQISLLQIHDRLKTRYSPPAHPPS